MTRCGRQFIMSASQDNTMVFYHSAEEDQLQDEDVYEDEELSHDEEEEEEIETCNIPAYVATKEYVNEQLEHAPSPQDEKDVANKAYVDRNIKNIKTHLEKIPKLLCSKLGNVNVMKKRLVNVAPPIKKKDGATKGSCSVMTPACIKFLLVLSQDVQLCYKGTIEYFGEVD
ncbi:Protein of unknown function [Gryllus bimaculatus]|nr:Protein of unknown function [Gryllus bimaculatus]